MKVLRQRCSCSPQMEWDSIRLERFVQVILSIDNELICTHNSGLLRPFWCLDGVSPSECCVKQPFWGVKYGAWRPRMPRTSPIVYTIGHYSPQAAIPKRGGESCGTGDTMEQGHMQRRDPFRALGRESASPRQRREATTSVIRDNRRQRPMWPEMERKEIRPDTKWN